MTELEIKSQIEQLATETKSAVDSKITEATKEMATKSQIADLEVKASKIESLEAAMRSQGEELVALKSANQVNQSAKPKSVAEEIKSYLENNKEQWDAFRRGEVKSFGSSKDGSAIDLSVKASTMLVSTNTSGSAFVPRPVYEGGLIDLVRNTPFIEQYANTALVGSPRIIYTEKVNPDGDADFIGEGVLKPLIDFDIRTTTVYAKKVADKIKVSTEMLDDIDFMAAEINNELKYQVDIHTDDQLLAGNGDGSEANANLKGLTSFAGGYVLTTIETTTPNNFDAIRAAAAQIMSLNFSANYAFVNPIDAANMDLTKGEDGQYTIPPFKSATGMDIAGIRVVETNQIPVGFFLVGDMTKFKVRNYKPFAISMGWVNDDFEKNLVTIIGERRLASYVSVNHTGAFVYDSFADVKTAITAA